MSAKIDPKNPSGTPHQIKGPEKISHAIARVNAFVFAFVLASIFGTGLFVMTAWLLIKGGENVGAHLKLLSHFFPGYSVTWPGSIIGFIYGILSGGIIGWAIGSIYNRIVDIRHQAK